MKPGLLPAVLLLAGCGASAPPNAILHPLADLPPKPAPIQMADRSESNVNGRVTERGFTWNFGNRPIQRVECGGVTSTSGLKPLRVRESTVRVLLRAGSLGKVKATVEVHQADSNGNGKTVTVGDVLVPGGIAAAIPTPNAELAGAGSRVTLLRWRGKGVQAPSGVVATLW